MVSYNILLGEDEVSFACHIKVLQNEWRKRDTDKEVVEELMVCTFPFRRTDILSAACDVLTLFEKYPFLQDMEQVYNYSYN